MIGGEHNPERQTLLSQAAQVRALLDRQHELLSRLDALSQRQMALIEEEEAGRLLDVMEERQHIVDRLSEAGAMLEPLRAGWSAAMQTLPAPEREEARRTIDAIALLMDQIAARDEQARRRLAERREEIAAELLNVDRGRGAVAAYGGANGAAGGPRFQDREA